MYIRRRLFAVLISFLLFSSLVLGGYLFCEVGKNARAVASDGYGYRRDIANLAYSLDRISDGLQKAVYAATPYRSAALAAELLAEAESARTSLASLPTYGLMLTRTNEFLSRVGDYSVYLTRKAINGDEISEEEKANLLSLAMSAAELASRVAEIESRAESENMDHESLVALFEVDESYWTESRETSADGSAGSDAPNEFMALEEIFPTAVFNYDGRYSDHLKAMSSAFLDSKDAVTEAQARENAANILSVSHDSLVLTGDVGTKSAKCYIFSTGEGDGTVYVTKQGGYLYSYSLNGETEMGELSLSREDAAAKAEAFLSRCGYSGLDLTYWKYQDDRLLLTYVTLNDGIRIYPEEINVAVSLTDGRVVYCDASGYLGALNRNRTFDFGNLTEDGVKDVISPQLEVEKVTRAVIQSPGGRDLYCYEALCRASDGTGIVVYINSQNGAEEESLILSETEEGYSAR